GVDRGGSGWRIAIRKFLERDWDTSVFSRCYRSSRKLYATNFVVPLTRSSVAPLAFGDADAVGSLWMVHYKGLLNCPATHTNGITFRFWGSADEFMMVRVDGEMVFAIGWPGTSESYLRSGLWDPSSAASRKHWLGDQKAEVGDWVTLKPGMPLNMEILIGDNGWATAFYLLVEEEGVEYERNSKGAPILPSFKTAELSDGLLDAIYKNLPEGAMVCLTNGLVFRDYDVSIKAVAANNESEKVEPAVPEDSGGNKVRTWTLKDGSTVEAEFVNIFAGKVVLKNAKGKTCKMPKERLSAEDIEYAELAKPPVLDINFLKNFRQVNFSGGFYDFRTWDRPSEQWGHCGFQIKQTGTGEYNHELHVEMFIVGKQSKRSKYILFDHQKTAFIPARQEQRFYEFHSDRKVVIALDEWMLWDVQHNFGEKYYGYLITVTDARGKVVAMKSSSKWLPGIVGNLRYLSVGNYFDKTGARTYPDRPPKRTYSQSF
ncbi:MAG: hypothetical protein KAH24_03030, partial [Holophagae bacterium]|nr:hypothetical protein [Holophagae bacterium]